MEDQELQRILSALSRFLGTRERSAKEIRARLRARRICSAEQADFVIEHLQSTGMVDESRFAANRALFRQEGGYGPYHIRAELKELGVSEADTEAALAECAEETFLASAVALGERLLPLLMKRPDSRLVMGRRMRARGFGEKHIRLALAELSDAYPHWARRTRVEQSRQSEQI